MTIFSRVKAKKPTDEIKDIQTIGPAAVSFPAISKPASIDPTKPAHKVTEAEVRARIAAHRRRQSDIIRRSVALSYTHSRSNSEYSFPGSGWKTHRTREPASIEAVHQDMPLSDAELLPPPLAWHARESTQRQSEGTLSRRHSEEFQAYSNPRAVPLPPPSKTTAPPPRSRSRRLTKRISPTVPIGDTVSLSSCSGDSARNSANTTSSIASSSTSASSIFNERAEPKCTSIKIPNFSKPIPTTDKKKPELEISLPYSSHVDNMEEEIKTAKSLIPTWRYEDLSTDNELPIVVPTISPAHTRNKSWGHTRKSSFGTFFHRRNLSTTAL